MGLLSKMDFQDLDEAEASAQQARALYILRKQRDAGKGTNEAARQQSHIDILKANRTIMGDGSKHIPTLRDKGIEATLKLSESNNTKVVVVGSPEDGLPLILGK